MPNHDWDALYRELEAATSGHDREELVGLLRDLIREYVIERGLPTGTPAQATGPDLAQMNFPTLVAHLKRTSPCGEWALFSVDGQRVIVDLDGPREVRAPARPAAGAAAATPVGQPAPVRRDPPAPVASPPARPAASAAPDAAGDDPSKAGEKPPVSRRFKHLEFD